MSKTHIEWTESTWNPVTGCNKISPGCKNCYAERMAKRLQAMNSPNYKNGFEMSLHKHVLEYPLHWKTPQTIFVNSMSDLFHENIPDQFIYDVFKVMNEASWHNFQILTKRSNNLLKITPNLNWTENIWMGVSIENQDYTYRIDNLSKTSAKIKFLSCEPLLGPLRDLDLTRIDWVIVGGESGPRARSISPDWVREIKNQCIKQKVPFFFKQWGGKNKKKNGRILDGQTWDQMPLKKVS
jgi:protein gp37